MSGNLISSRMSSGGMNDQGFFTLNGGCYGNNCKSNLVIKRKNKHSGCYINDFVIDIYIRNSNSL